MLLPLFSRLRVMKAFADKEAGQERRQYHRNEEGRNEGDRHGQWQRANELTGSARKHQERQEGADDGQGRGKHRNRKLSGAAPCCFFPVHAFIEQFDVVIRNHDRVIHNHPEHDNECGYGNLMQLDAKGIE